MASGIQVTPLEVARPSIGTYQPFQQPDPAAFYKNFQSGQKNASDLQTAAVQRDVANRQMSLKELERGDANSQFDKTFGLQQLQLDRQNKIADAQTTQLGLRSQQEQLQLDQQKLALVRELTGSVLNAPEKEQAEMYKRNLGIAKKMGIDISDLPPEWNDQAKAIAAQTFMAVDKKIKGTTATKQATGPTYPVSSFQDQAQPIAPGQVPATNGAPQLPPVNPAPNTAPAQAPVDGQAAPVPAAAPQQLAPLQTNNAQFNKNMAEKDAQTYKESSDAITKLTDVNYNLDVLEKYNDQVPVGVVSRLAQEGASAIGITTEGNIAYKQTEQAKNNLTLIFKDIFKMGSQGFTEADRQFIEVFMGNPNDTPAQRRVTIAKLRLVAQYQTQKNLGLQSYIEHNGSSLGFERAWAASHPGGVRGAVEGPKPTDLSSDQRAALKQKYNLNDDQLDRAITLQNKQRK